VSPLRIYEKKLSLFMRKSSRWTTLLALLIAAAAAFYYYRNPRRPEPTPGPVSGRLIVRFLDIGQGDAQLIQLPGGQTILIDSGDRGAPTVDLLKKYGVSEIELAIATHPHADHIGEMRDVMRAFKVKELWDSGLINPTKTYADMLEERKARGIQFLLPRRGQSRKIGETLIEVLNPSDNLPDKNANNASIVVRLTYGNTRFLFTGDAEVESWEQMIESGKDGLKSDLLKAAHHGSSNGMTKEILDAVRPSIVTISCAVGNDYHHPHPKVMQLLEQRRQSCELYRTDLQGTITAVSDGSKIEVSTEKQIVAGSPYLTGDEVAGKVASDGEGKTEGKRARRRAM
jgi:competence protein ComEC